jgi:hypothetical protein
MLGAYVSERRAQARAAAEAEKKDIYEEIYKRASSEVGLRVDGKECHYVTQVPSSIMWHEWASDAAKKAYNAGECCEFVCKALAERIGVIAVQHTPIILVCWDVSRFDKRAMPIGSIVYAPPKRKEKPPQPPLRSMIPKSPPLPPKPPARKEEVDYVEISKDDPTSKQRLAEFLLKRRNT